MIGSNKVVLSLGMDLLVHRIVMYFLMTKNTTRAVECYMQLMQIWVS